MLESEAHADRMVRCPDHGASTHGQILKAKLKKYICSHGQGGDGFHVTASQAEIADVAPDRVFVLRAAKLNSAGTVIARIFSAAGQSVFFCGVPAARCFECAGEAADFFKVKFNPTHGTFLHEDGLVLQALDAHLSRSR